MAFTLPCISKPIIFRACMNDLNVVMRKPAFCKCENKDADQLCGHREADQCLCFRSIDNKISPLSKPEIPSLQPSSVTVQPRLYLIWLETLQTVFLMTQLIFIVIISGDYPLDSNPVKGLDVNDSMTQPKRRDFKPNFDWVTGRLARKEQMLGRKLSYGKNCTKVLPQALIVGVMKCGTEALSSFLAIHPDIAMQLKLQTVCFFNYHYMHGYDWYRNQMPCSSEGQITMEKSPQYFTSRFVPERIHEMNSSIKLIMIMREPIKRAISHYTHVLDIKPGLYPNSFEKTITGPLGNIDSGHETISRSLYSVQLKPWLEYFKMEQIHIVNADNFKVNQAEELNKIENFLGLRHYITEDFFTYNTEKGFYCLSKNATGGNVGCMASGKGRQHPDVSPDMMDRLKKFFKPFNEEFFQIIGQRFDWGY